MTDPRRIAHAMNPRPFAHPIDRDDTLGPSILKEAEEERQELIRRAEGVLVELQAENARLRDVLGHLTPAVFELMDACDKYGAFDNLMPEFFPDSVTRGVKRENGYNKVMKARANVSAWSSAARAALNAGGTDE